MNQHTKNALYTNFQTKTFGLGLFPDIVSFGPNRDPDLARSSHLQFLTQGISLSFLCLLAYSWCQIMAHLTRFGGQYSPIDYNAIRNSLDFSNITPEETPVAGSQGVPIQDVASIAGQSLMYLMPPQSGHGQHMPLVPLGQGVYRRWCK